VINYTLFINSLIGCAAAAIYAYIANRLGRRQIRFTEARLAWTFFVVWWYALAAATLSTAVISLVAAFGVLTLPLYLTITYVNLPAACVALFGLTYYLLYLFTGSRKLLLPLAVFYSLFYTLVMYAINVHNPVGIRLERWQIAVQYEIAPAGPLLGLLIVLLLFPQIIGSLAYFSLYFRVEGTTQKYRILLVSWGIIIWFIRPLLASLFGVAQQEWWQIVTVLIGLGAALIILMAYQPPEWIKQRYNVTSIVEEPT